MAAEPNVDLDAASHGTLHADYAETLLEQHEGAVSRGEPNAWGHGVGAVDQAGLCSVTGVRP